MIRNTLLQAFIIKAIIVAGAIFFARMCPYIYIVLCPGILLLWFRLVPLPFLLQIILVVTSSLAYWIVGLAFLKFIPISYTLLFQITVGVSLFTILVFRPRFRLSVSIEDVAAILSFGYIFYIFWTALGGFIVPSGADMATHAYTARVVYEANTFPKAYAPFVPIPFFGFAPFGMSAIIALTSLLSHVEIHTASLMVTIATYTLVSMSCYFFLRLYFGFLPSVITMFMSILVEREFTSYVRWGANPTVFSIPFLVMGISMIVLMFKKWRSKPKEQWVFFVLAPLFLSASFYTHQTALVVFGYCLIVPILYFRKLLIQRNSGKKIITLYVVSAAMLLPFIASLRLMTPIVYSHLLEMTRQVNTYRIIRGFPEVFISGLQYSMQRLGDRFLLPAIFGALLLLPAYKKHLVYYCAILTSYFLLVNSQYWVLPLSGVLYPDRVMTATQIVYMYFVAAAIAHIQEQIKKRTAHKTVFQYVLLTGIIIVVSCYIRDNVVYIQKDVLTELSYKEVMVTQNDLRALYWIRDHTQPTAVVANNYGDAGLWIPTIAKRMITWNDSTPHYLDLLEEAQQALVPTHLFIGEVPVYEGGIRYTNKKMQYNPDYDVAFQAGNAVVYQRK